MQVASPLQVDSGNSRPSSVWGEYNTVAFAIQQALAKMQTSTLVRVEKCTNSGGLSPVGFVDITPLVNQIDNSGIPIPHTTIFNVPYCRIQGGNNAVIIDPAPGDIGMACFASRDLSKVKATRKQANPGSRRKFSFSDAMYLGGMLNGAPTQFIQFSQAGIVVTSPVKVQVNAPAAEINAQTANVNASTSAAITAPAITLGASGQSLLHFITSAFQSLFNGHTHNVIAVGSQTAAPLQQLGSSHMTSTVSGG